MGLNKKKEETTIDRYIKDMVKECPAPLKKQEETKLIEIIAKGREAKIWLKKSYQLSPMLIEILTERIEHSQQAKNTLIKANLRFVIFTAKKYYHFVINFIPFSDLVQDGNLGLVIAAEKASHGYKNKFYSYAVWWIKKEIQETVNRKKNNIILPHNFAHTLSCFKKILKQKIKNQEPITAKIISKEMNITLKTAEALIGLPYTVSINSITTDKKTIEGIIPNTSTQITEEERLLLLIKKIIEKSTSLDERERYIFEKYTIGQTLQKIGKRFNLSRQRIFQIYETAITKIKANIPNLKEELLKSL
ncbi:MAG: sigma-70 family RNA polymerase sigma factor [bacterium]